MPNFDKTGPAGQGSATGRGGGSCAESSQVSFRGRGRGCCRMGRFNQNRGEGVSLDDQEQFLEKRLEEVRTAQKQLKSKSDNA